ncbi:uncharacterized protein LOC125958016 [Anopheles darlingi]|uniref:uncharacterized protein LOC125958016 n=1 Tax=Anopheles darlingi TaxID=43151 RepID=UPI0021005F10|nr:uncharacterized protein LOC125958016 [Anopheles darlingi]
MDSATRPSATANDRETPSERITSSSTVPRPSSSPADGVYRFNWFLSLRRKRSSPPQTSTGAASSIKKNDGGGGGGQTGVRRKDDLFTSENHGSVFYTLRKRFQKKFTSVKVKAYEPDVASGVTNSSASASSTNAANPPLRDSDAEFARIVIERHTQNPIRFSSPNANLPVIMNRDTVPNTGAVQGSDNAGDPSARVDSQQEQGEEAEGECRPSLDETMERMRIDLLQYGWYWGKLTRSAAQKRLARQVNGTFLVRDSQTEKYQFTVSFRSSGITLHCRIDFKNNYWSFSGLTTPSTYATMIELVEDTMKKSEFGVIGYVKQNSPLMPPFPVRLTKPINRFYEVSTLQHLCRFIIRQKIDPKDIAMLPLPVKLKQYVEENFYDL